MNNLWSDVWLHALSYHIYYSFECNCTGKRKNVFALASTEIGINLINYLYFFDQLPTGANICVYTGSRVLRSPDSLVKENQARNGNWLQPSWENRSNKFMALG